MSDDRHSKTEQPTAKRQKEAGKKGGPPRSKEIAAAVSLLLAAAGLAWTGERIVTGLMELTRSTLGHLESMPVTNDNVYRLMLDSSWTFVRLMTPFFLVATLAGVVVAMGQGGITVSMERLALKTDRLNPLNGFKRLFKAEMAMEMAKSMVKIVIVAYVAYRAISTEADAIILLLGQDLQAVIAVLGRVSLRLLLHSCGVLLVLGALDYAWVKWRHLQELKMTKQEVKDEQKESEGDPKVKSRLRSLQFERARRRIVLVVPEADVIVTNPTHYAVALKYDPKRASAPVVLAKGVDHLALKIREIARQHKVMIVENRFLARELYAQVKENAEIPESLYVAVAEVLAYVYSLRQQ
jgi:flagellar biosynthetic protein FlhB